MKRIIIGTVLFTAIGLTALGLNINAQKSSTGELEASLIDTNRIVGSKMQESFIRFSWEQFKDADHLMSFSDLVLTGTVLDDGNNIEDEFPQSFEDEEKQKYFRSTRSIKIDEILFGEYNAEEILFEQMGKADSDIGETKVKKGDKVLLFLEANKYGYSAVGQEQGIFVIKSDKAISLSDNMDIINKYDNRDDNLVKDDIIKAKKSSKHKKVKKNIKKDM